MPEGTKAVHTTTKGMQDTAHVQQHAYPCPAAQPKPMVERPSSSIMSDAIEAVYGRQEVVEALPVEAFQCQLWEPAKSVLALEPDQALMMVLQYDNGYSSDSVAVQTLSGTLLGYVPRRHNHRFVHDVNFGHVYAVGQDAAGLWRLTVACRPSLSSLTIDAFPTNLKPYINLSRSLAPTDWQNICEAVHQEAESRCHVSGGAGQDWQVEVCEVWRHFSSSRILKLMGFTALHTDVLAVKSWDPSQQQDNLARQQVLQMLQSMNEWDDIEAEDYLKYVTDQDYRRQKTPWQMDLNWLTDKGYVIPPQLRHLCCAQKAENVLEQRSEVPGSRTKKFIKKSYSRSRCLIQ